MSLNPKRREPRPRRAINAGRDGRGRRQPCRAPKHPIAGYPVPPGWYGRAADRVYPLFHPPLVSDVSDTTTDLLTALQTALGPQYRLERELGRGGMGVVFLATDTNLDRPVAIKVVHPELAAHESITRRFLAEARTSARLRHPNIVAVHAAGSAEGLLYYVMDEVAGESLRQKLLREGRIPPADTARILCDLAAALNASGRAGVVHRDVKPENVLLDEATGRAMLAGLHEP